jgi:hypothetical protein
VPEMAGGPEQRMHGDALIYPLSSLGHARCQAGTLPHSRHAAYWVIEGNSRLTIAAPKSPQKPSLCVALDARSWRTTT